MMEWIKNKLGITALEEENAQLWISVNQLRAMINEHRSFVASKVAELKEYTRVDADVGIRGNNTIILTGVYKRRAYVRFYDLGDGEFEELVRRIRNMKDHCLIRNIDSPPSFRGSFEI